MSTAPDAPRRVLIVGRSPGVLIEAVTLLRARGYAADATNQFDTVLEDYDAGTLDVVLLGGAVPPATREHLRAEITARNPGASVADGLAGIAGVIAAHAESLSPARSPTPALAPAPGDIAYDSARRTVRVTLPAPARVTVEAWWATSFTPPEPTSTSLLVRDGRLDAGPHGIGLPDDVPSVASFAVVRVTGSGTPSPSAVRVFTVGAVPTSVTRLLPGSGSGRRLPDVAAVTTHGGDR